MTNIATPDAAELVAIYKRAALLKANDDRAARPSCRAASAMIYYSYRGRKSFLHPRPAAARR